MTARSLIVNADDFGQSDGINQGIIDAHERGIVTSASLMVRWPAAASAAAWGADHPEVSIGLHIDLGEWRFRNGAWEPVYAVVPLADLGAVAREIATQFERFHDLMGRPPTHVDSHQHVHLRPGVREIVSAHTSSLGVPLRQCGEGPRYCSAFYGQTADGSPTPESITVSALIRILEALPAGATELGCHPGFAVAVDMMYAREREQEVSTLCDPAVRTALVDYRVTLTSFADFRGGR